MTGDMNKQDPKRVRKKAAFIGIARWISILSFACFLPAAVLCLILGFEFINIAPFWSVIFIASGAYAMFARCPRCQKPVHHEPVNFGSEKRSKKRSEHHFFNSNCIHCGLSISLMSTNTEGYTRADYLGPGALPIVVRFKGLLIYLGASLANMILCIFLYQAGFWEMSWYWHVVTGALSFTAMTGVFRFLFGYQFFMLLKDIRSIFGWKRFAVILGAVLTLISSPINTLGIFKLLERFVF